MPNKMEIKVRRSHILEGNCKIFHMSRATMNESEQLALLMMDDCTSLQHNESAEKLITILIYT